MAKSKSEGINWGHWANLRKVRVYEALALLDGQEPPEDCPDADDESPAYRKRMRLLLDALSNREWFGPLTLNISEPLLHGLSLAELGRWARANGYTLPDEFPCAVARAGATQNSESASSDAVTTTTKPDSSRVTIFEAKRRIRKSSPHELFIDFYEGADGTLTAVADGVPKSIFAGHLDEDFAGNCKKLGIVPTWKYRPGKIGYTGDPTTDDLYTITQGELDQLASLYGLSLGVGTPPPQEFVTSPRPSCIPPKLQELDSSATVKAVFDMGGMNGWGFPTAAEYIAEIQERIERQAQDLFTVAEAAQVLSMDRPSKDGKAWVQEMRAAHCTGALAIRDESQIPFKPARPADNAVIPNTWTAAQTMPRNHADLVKGADVDAWLRATAGYGFPEAEGASLPPPADSASVTQQPAPDRGRHLKRAALIAENMRRWPTVERDLRDGATNGLSTAAKDTTKVGWWWEGSALDWARARHKVDEPSHSVAAWTGSIHRMKG